MGPKRRRTEEETSAHEKKELNKALNAEGKYVLISVNKCIKCNNLHIL